nr:MAG: putative coat protein [Leviviridae sp.]
MLGDTITITLGGSGGTARVCNKINQDNYSAEYLNRNSTDEIRVKVRHSKESNLLNGLPVERHNMEITQTVFPAVVGDPSVTRQWYFVARCNPDDTVADQVDVGEALAFFMDATNLPKIVGWES